MWRALAVQFSDNDRLFEQAFKLVVIKLDVPLKTNLYDKPLHILGQEFLDSVDRNNTIYEHAIKKTLSECKYIPLFRVRTLSSLDHNLLERTYFSYVYNISKGSIPNNEILLKQFINDCDRIHCTGKPF